MYTQLALATFGLVASAAALPVAGNDKPSGSWPAQNGAEVVSYTAKFDNVEAGLVGSLPVRPVTPLGVYDDLFFNLNVINVGTGLTGVKPQSAPNVVTYDAIFQATEGVPSIYADYDDSIAESFRLKELYFGCVITNVETAASVANDCTVTVTGYRNEEQVASQDIVFKTGGLLGQAVTATMDKAEFGSDFANLDKVEFATDGLQQAVDAVLIDNVSYEVTLKQGMSQSY
ncbi:hypothetical protein LTR78_010124 [Recurvomyces mirabilis]|uniref:Uncharacterized protein n=1 Tax=Recurvomyces mirabilis TaxID=574656 RepID=A0AAE0WH16_9PEZI|nr:hypothetical protein LTR78_010124 [Recurvomyces mirabilis]KAK5149915.1 hypothetical protein LTS14_010520 [Recurvomyces mirabilis]